MATHSATIFTDRKTTFWANVHIIIIISRLFLGNICGPVNYYRAALRYKPTSSSLTRKISKPTLLIWGTADGALEKKMAEMSKKYVENLKVEYIEGASHWVQQECPAEFNAHMKKFISH